MSKLYRGDLCRLVEDDKPYFEKGDVVIVLENDSPNNLRKGVMNVLALGVSTYDKESYWIDGELLELLPRDFAETKETTEEKITINVDKEELIEMLTKSVSEVLKGSEDDDWKIAEPCESIPNESRVSTVEEAKKFIGEIMFLASTDYIYELGSKYESDLLYEYYTAPKVLLKRDEHKLILEGQVRGLMDGRVHRELSLHIDTTKETFNYYIATASLLAKLYYIDSKHLSFSEERPQPSEVKKGMLVQSNNTLYCGKPYVVGKVVNGDAYDEVYGNGYIPVEYLDILEDSGAYE